MEFLWCVKSSSAESCVYAREYSVVKLFRPFGWEQFIGEKNPLLSWVGQLVGEPHFGTKVRSYYMAKAVRAFCPSRVERILDAGCGKGQTTFWLNRNFPKAQIDSIDINPALIQHCRNVAKNIRAENISFAVQNLCSFREEKKYDLIVCCDVLEHVENWKDIVRNLSNALRPGGLLLMHVPHAGRFQDLNFGLRKYLKETIPDENGKEVGAAHVHEGLKKEDFEILKNSGVDYSVFYTFGFMTMWAHTLFEIYRGFPRYWHLILTPLLSIIPHIEKGKLKDGGGLLIKLIKASS